MIRNYSDKLVPVIERAVERFDHDAKDRVTFELMFGVQPTEQGVPAFTAMLVLIMPSAVIGQAHMNMASFLPVGMTDDKLAELVREGIEQLRSARTQSIAQPNGSLL